MLSLNTILASGTVSYFFPTLMGALGYKGRMVQCKSTWLDLLTTLLTLFQS